MYGFWIRDNNDIVGILVMFFLSLLYGIAAFVNADDERDYILSGFLLLVPPILSMLFFILLLLSAIIYPFHIVEKGCDNLPREKSLGIAFNRAVESLLQ